MQPPVFVRPGDHLRRAIEAMVGSALRELPVLDERDAIVGFIDEADIARSYLDSAVRSERGGT